MDNKEMIQEIEAEEMPENTMMSEEQFKEYLENSVNLRQFDMVRKYKSVLRAFRRGHMTPFGIEIPKRPFNNRKDTKGRKMNRLKKQIYYELSNRSRKVEETTGV